MSEPTVITHQNLASLFLAQAARYGTRDALLVKRDGKYQSISWSKFKFHVEKVGVGLRKMGIQKGDRVGIFSENRPEWAYTDLGTLGIGAITVPIYPTASLNEIAYVIDHAAIKVIFVSTKEQLLRIRPLLFRGNSIRHVVVMEEFAVDHPQVLTWPEFLASASLSGVKPEVEFKELVAQVLPDDLATVIYTSGTTGPPKGVMLSHRNFLINCIDAARAIELHEDDMTLSFLPLSHVFERLAGFYFPLMVGATIAYAENMNTVPQNLLEVRPMVACGVPRVYEKIHQRVMEVVEKSPVFLRKLAEWAIYVGYQTIPFRLKKKPMPLGLRLKYQIAHLLIFKKLKKQLGGRLKFFISGGAALPKALGEFFYAAGISILEGYGLTETSPVVSVNRLDRLKFGTVGIPFDHVKVRIDADGEILVQGQSVMVGYYQDPHATSEMIRKDWLYTGDVGQFDSEGFLMITDRKKDIIVTSGGKNISPQNIESLIKRSSIIHQIVVLGDQHHYLVSLIVPNWEAVVEKLALVNIPREKLISDERVIQFIRKEIDALTVDLANYEKVKYFRLLPRELTQEKGELTPTLKVKRRMVAEQYAGLIRSMYEEGEKKKRL